MNTEQILEVKIEIAKMVIELDQFWNKVYRNNAEPSLKNKEEYRIFSQSQRQKIIALLPPDMVIDSDVTGFCRDVSHYDIDDEIVKHFPYVIADSESGQFFAYCNSFQAESISDFLKQKFPSLEFKISKRKNPEDFQNPFFPNSGYAYRFLKEMNIDVPEVSSDKIPVVSDEFGVADEIVEMIYSKYKDVSPSTILKVIQKLRIEDYIIESSIASMGKWEWEYLMSRKNEQLSSNVQ